MADLKIDLTGAKFPHADGEDNEYAYKPAVDSGFFDKGRKVIFVNGVDTTGAGHAENALALSLVQMCVVVGVYNATAGRIMGLALRDFAECLGDKNQFNGPLSFSAKAKVTLGATVGRQTREEAARHVLGRNRAQSKLFDLLRKEKNRRWEIFAHSQGNLLVCNVLQAIAAIDGPGGISGYIVHTFGSPSVHANWPATLTKREHAFTWDPITWFAGFDKSLTISKVGRLRDPGGLFAHGFLEYLKYDPAFVVNRYGSGVLGITYDMDEHGLAQELVEMGTNMKRVLTIFEYLNTHHETDADDVAIRYIQGIAGSPQVLAALAGNRRLVDLLIRILDEGWTGKEEKKAIAFLRAI